VGEDLGMKNGRVTEEAVTFRLTFVLALGGVCVVG